MTNLYPTSSRFGAQPTRSGHSSGSSTSTGTASASMGSRSSSVRFSGLGCGGAAAAGGSGMLAGLFSAGRKAKRLLEAALQDGATSGTSGNLSTEALAGLSTEEALLEICRHYPMPRGQKQYSGDGPEQAEAAYQNRYQAAIDYGVLNFTPEQGQRLLAALGYEGSDTTQLDEQVTKILNDETFCKIDTDDSGSLTKSSIPASRQALREALSAEPVDSEKVLATLEKVLPSWKTSKLPADIGACYREKQIARYSDPAIRQAIWASRETSTDWPKPDPNYQISKLDSATRLAIQENIFTQLKAKIDELPDVIDFDALKPILQADFPEAFYLAGECSNNAEYLFESTAEMAENTDLQSLRNEQWKPLKEPVAVAHFNRLAGTNTETLVLQSTPELVAKNKISKLDALRLVYRLVTLQLNPWVEVGFRHDVLYSALLEESKKDFQ